MRAVTSAEVLGLGQQLRKEHRGSVGWGWGGRCLDMVGRVSLGAEWSLSQVTYSLPWWRG